MEKQLKLTPIEFCYFLQGYNEINNNVPNSTTWSRIKKTLDNVNLETKYDNTIFNANFFIVWLKGYVELSSPAQGFELTPKQWEIIIEHLQLVFNKITKVNMYSEPKADSFSGATGKVEHLETLLRKKYEPCDKSTYLFIDEKPQYLIC